MINNVTLLGRITHSMELKKTPAGKSVLNFQIAVDRKYTNGQEKATDFLDCVAWNATAEFIYKYFKKGEMIALIGEVQTREYESSDKKKRKVVEIMVSDASFCGSKKDTKSVPNEEPKEEFVEQIIVADKDLPF